jgi:hypothetical protein
MKLKMDKNVMVINYKQPAPTEYTYGDLVLENDEVIGCYPDLGKRLIDKGFAHEIK